MAMDYGYGNGLVRGRGAACAARPPWRASGGCRPARTQSARVASETRASHHAAPECQDGFLRVCMHGQLVPAISAATGAATAFCRPAWADETVVGSERAN